jgi:hypothetical protein
MCGGVAALAFRASRTSWMRLLNAVFDTLLCHHGVETDRVAELFHHGVALSGVARP